MTYGIHHYDDSMMKKKYIIHHLVSSLSHHSSSPNDDYYWMCIQWFSALFHAQFPAGFDAKSPILQPNTRCQKDYSTDPPIAGLTISFITFVRRDCWQS